MEPIAMDLKHEDPFRRFLVLGGQDNLTCEVSWPLSLATPVLLAAASRYLAMLLHDSFLNHKNNLSLHFISSFLT